MIIPLKPRVPRLRDYYNFGLPYVLGVEVPVHRHVGMIIIVAVDSDRYTFRVLDSDSGVASA